MHRIAALALAVAAGVLIGVAAHRATAAPFDNGCIPCGPHKACANPLTVCVANTPSGNGCCLGLAGQ